MTTIERVAEAIKAEDDCYGQFGEGYKRLASAALDAICEGLEWGFMSFDSDCLSFNGVSIGRVRMGTKNGRNWWEWELGNGYGLSPDGIANTEAEAREALMERARSWIRGQS